MDFTIVIPESEYLFGFIVGVITMGIAILVVYLLSKRLLK